VSSNTEKQPA